MSAYNCLQLFVDLMVLFSYFYMILYNEKLRLLVHLICLIWSYLLCKKNGRICNIWNLETLFLFKGKNLVGKEEPFQMQWKQESCMLEKGLPDIRGGIYNWWLTSSIQKVVQKCLFACNTEVFEPFHEKTNINYGLLEMYRADTFRLRGIEV